MKRTKSRNNGKTTHNVSITVLESHADAKTEDILIAISRECTGLDQEAIAAKANSPGPRLAKVKRHAAASSEAIARIG
jgi:hypothetical protein